MERANAYDAQSLSFMGVSNIALTAPGLGPGVKVYLNELIIILQLKKKKHNI